MIVRHAVVKDSFAVPELPGSSQAALRHPELAAYRCFLPDLTGFTGLRRVEPNYQRRVVQADAASQASSAELHPAVADCGYRAPLAPRLARPPIIVAIPPPRVNGYEPLAISRQLIRQRATALGDVCISRNQLSADS